MRIYYPENPKPKAPFLTKKKKKKKTKEGDPVNVQQHAVVVPVLATSIPEKNTTAQFQEEQGGAVIDDPSEINDRTISRNPYSASSEETMARDSVMKSSLALVNPNNPPSVNNEGEIMNEATRGDDSATGCNDILDATAVQKDLKREWELAPFREALERFIQSDEFFVIKHRPTLHPVDNFQHGFISKSSPKHKDSKSLLHLPPSDTSIFVGSEKEQWPKDQQTTTAPPPGVVVGTVEIQTVLSNNNWSSESSKENTEHPSLLNEQSLSLPPPTLVDTVKEESDEAIDDNHHDYQRSQNNPPRTKSIWDDNDDESTKCPTDESVDLKLTNTSNDEDVPSRQSDDDDDEEEEEEEEEEEDKYDEESFQSCHSKKSDLAIKPLNNATAVESPISLPTMQLLDDTACATDDDLQPYPSIGTVDAIPVEVRDDNYVDVVHHRPQPFLQENKKGCSWVFDLKDDEAELVEDVRQQSYSESEDSEDYSSSFISEVVV